MNIKQLEAYVLVAELGSFTKAAKALFMTQPAISFQIKALEEQLGIQLMERAEKNIFLTDIGKLVYAESKKILAGYRSILELVAQVQGITRGTLILGASTIPGEYLLPQYLGEFKNLHPEVELVLEIGSTNRIIELVLSRQVHLGVVGAVITHQNLEYTPIFADEVVVITSENHPLAQRETVTVEELAQESLIFREKGSGTRSVVEERFTQAGIKTDEIKIVMELGSTRAIITAVQGNLGVGIVSGLAVKDSLELKNVRKVQLLGVDLHRRLYMVTNKANQGSPLQKAFSEFLLLKAGQLFGGNCDD